jgi:hypothetical protein
MYAKIQAMYVYNVRLDDRNVRPNAYITLTLRSKSFPNVRIGQALAVIHPLDAQHLT